MPGGVTRALTLCLFSTWVALPACEGVVQTPAGTAAAPATPAISSPIASHLASEAAGHWYLNRDGERITLIITEDAGTGQLSGHTLSETASAAANPIVGAETTSSGILRFQVSEPSGTASYQVRVIDGVLSGRYVVSENGSTPTQLRDYSGRVTGWRDETFRAEARVWDVVLDGHTQAVLRLDRAATGSTSFLGTVKPYATDGQLDEQPSEDIEVRQWDGHNLTFVRATAPGEPVYTGAETGRTLAVTASISGGAPTAWNGTRVEILTHGLGTRSAREVGDWQTRTRRRLALLAFGGNPPPSSMKVSEIGVSDPIAYSDDDGDRDDDAASWPQSYLLHELAFDSTLPGLWDGESLTRHAHGYLAVPTSPPPTGGYPVALALNGHDGSAHDTLDPQGPYWFGDSFARRGFVVLAIDVGHRPLADRASVYTDLTDGDDPSTGNDTHPAIEEPGSTSDWEEDGERAWDAVRGLDYLLGRSDVNPKNVVGVGLSMGGEITDWVAAMDTRVAVAFATGNPSDLAVMRLHGNHPCWNWQRADAREYYDPGDLNALVAGRVLVRETGRQDSTYSSARAPFGTAKEVVRRAQPAFTAAGGQLVHYLHFDAHAFHVGLFCAVADAAAGVTTPTQQAPDPATPWSTDWTSDADTTTLAPSIFALIPGSG